jgi:hypothetical protein
MNPQTENQKISDVQPTSRDSETDRFANTERDEATLGVSGNRQNSPELADEDQPIQRPPESIPEPRPPTPNMNSSPNSSQSTNTNSPA